MILGVFLALFLSMTMVSQTAMDVFAVLFVLTMGWLGWRWKVQESFNRAFNPTGIDWVFPFWILIVTMGLLINSPEDSVWLLRVLSFKWLLLFYSLIGALIYLRPEEVAAVPLTVVFIIGCVYAILVFFLGWDPIYPDHHLDTFGNGVVRTGGLLVQPIVFSHLYGMFLCLLFGLALVHLRWKERLRWLYLFALIVGGLAIVLSFTRGVWLALPPAIVLMTFLYSRRASVILSVVGIVFVLGLSQFWSGFRDRISQAIEGGDADRVWIWKSNLEMVKEHPILGVGYGENNRLLPTYYQQLGGPHKPFMAHAHNQYLHFLAGTGAVGFLLWLFVLGYFLLLSFRVWRAVSVRNIFHQGLIIGCIGAQVFFMVGSLTEANWEHGKVQNVLLFVWALVVWLGYEHQILKRKV